MNWQRVRHIALVTCGCLTIVLLLPFLVWRGELDREANVQEFRTECQRAGARVVPIGHELVCLIGSRVIARRAK